MNLSPSDRAALEIGRLFLRAHSAEQQAATLAVQLAELEAKGSEETPATADLSSSSINRSN